MNLQPKFRYFILLFSITMLGICGGTDLIIENQHLISLNDKTYEIIKDDITDKYIRFYIENFKNTEKTNDRPNVAMYVCDMNFIIAYLCGIKQNGWFHDCGEKYQIDDLNKKIQFSKNTFNMLILIKEFKDTDINKTIKMCTNTNKKKLTNLIKNNKLLIISKDTIIEFDIGKYYYKLSLNLKNLFSSEYKKQLEEIDLLHINEIENFIIKRIKEKYTTGEEIIKFLQNNSAPFLNKTMIVKLLNEPFHLGDTYESILFSWPNKNKDLLNEECNNLLLPYMYDETVIHTTKQIVKIDKTYLKQTLEILEFYYNLFNKVKNIPINDKDKNILENFLNFKVLTENEFFINYAENLLYQSIIFYDNNILKKHINKKFKYLTNTGKSQEEVEKLLAEDVEKIMLKPSIMILNKINHTREEKIKLIIRDLKNEDTDKSTSLEKIKIDELKDAIIKLPGKISALKNLIVNTINAKSENTDLITKLKLSDDNITINSKKLYAWLLLSLFNVDFALNSFVLKEISIDIFTQHIYDHISQNTNEITDTGTAIPETKTANKTKNQVITTFKTDHENNFYFTYNFIKNFLTGELPIEYFCELNNSIELIIKIKNAENKYISPISGAIQKKRTNIGIQDIIIDSSHAKMVLKKSLIGYYITTIYPLPEDSYNGIIGNNKYIKCAGKNLKFIQESLVTNTTTDTTLDINKETSKDTSKDPIKVTSEHLLLPKKEYSIFIDLLEKMYNKDTDKEIFNIFDTSNEFLVFNLIE